MCYGNFIKRFLTIAWAFTGLVALVLFREAMEGAESQNVVAVSETLFGRSIRELLGDGWRGLMIACIIAGVTSAETIMVVGSGVFTRNFFVHLAPSADDRTRLWVGRVASGGMLLVGILLALGAESITELLNASYKLIGLMGPIFWLGVTWRRANPAGAWCSLAAGLAVWMTTAQGLPDWFDSLHPLFAQLSQRATTLSRPLEILIMLGAQFGLLVFVSLVTRPQPRERLDPFFARLHIPVGREEEFASAQPPEEFQEEATLGLHGISLDYGKASQLAAPRLQRFGFEIPRLSFSDCAGFVGAWATVAGLIALLVWLSTLGRA